MRSFLAISDSDNLSGCLDQHFTGNLALLSTNISLKHVLNHSNTCHNQGGAGSFFFGVLAKVEGSHLRAVV